MARRSELCLPPGHSPAVAGQQLCDGAWTFPPPGSVSWPSIPAVSSLHPEHAPYSSTRLGLLASLSLTFILTPPHPLNSTTPLFIFKVMGVTLKDPQMAITHFRPHDRAVMALWWQLLGVILRDCCKLTGDRKEVKK